MNNPSVPVFDWERFEAMPLIGIMRGFSQADIEEILPRYLAAGLSTLEITMNTDGVEDQIASLVEKYGDQLNIGAGTVLSLDDISKATLAGASFIVTPVLKRNVIERCNELCIPIFPGAFSPTEIYQAAQWGADMVKVFPANDLGPSYIKNILAPLNELKLIPTGGVNLSNAQTYFDIGAKGLGLGGGLFDKKMIADRDWETLEQHFLAWAKLVSAE